MATFRKTREAIMIAHAGGVINKEEFVVLYNLNTSKNLDFPYGSTNHFIWTISDAECKSEFRFYRNDIHDFFNKQLAYKQQY